MNIGQAIKSVREERGLSQAAVAENSGISRTALSNIETGDARPNLDTVVAIAEALGVRAGELIESARESA